MATSTERQLEQLQGTNAARVSGVTFDSQLDQMSGKPTESSVYNEGSERVQADFDSRIESIEADKEASNQAFQTEIERIRSDYTTERLDADSLLGGLRDAYQDQIGAVANAYNAQAAREAERTDALIAGGSLGGNAYRAFQAQTQSSRDLVGQSMAQIAQLTVQAESKLAEMGVSIAGTNAQLFESVNKTIGSLVASQAQSALSYSSLLGQTELAAEQSIQNLYSLGLQERELDQRLLMETRAQDIQLELGYLQANTQLQLQRLGPDSASFIPVPTSYNVDGTPMTPSDMIFSRL